MEGPPATKVILRERGKKGGQTLKPGAIGIRRNQHQNMRQSPKSEFFGGLAQSVRIEQDSVFVRLAGPTHNGGGRHFQSTPGP